MIDTAAQAVTAFKEKGREEMNRVLQKGISGVQSVLSGCREKMVDVLTSYEKTANQIDSIGDEFKQIGNSVANVGRLLTGKVQRKCRTKRGRCPYKGTEYACKEAYLSLKETGGAD